MSKSRQEKTKTPAQSAPPPPVSNDVVPGRFTDSDWNQMVEAEDGEDFINDIVQEIVESTMGVLHDRYIQKQTLPYTVQETRKLLLDIIEWQFLACDSGEENPSVDPTWLQEDEPIAAVTDSWAQGSVPVLIPRPSSTESSATSVSSEVNSEDSCIEEERPGAPQPPFEKRDIPDTPETIPSPAQSSQPNSPEAKPIQPKPPPKKVSAKQKKRTGPFKVHKGKLPAFSGVDLTSVTDLHVMGSKQNKNAVPTLDEKGLALLSSSSSILKGSSSSSSAHPSWSDDQHSFSRCISSLESANRLYGKTQHGRPPGQKDVIFDEWGNVAAVLKINPNKLPSHRVRTRFTVVDQGSETNGQIRKQANRKPINLKKEAKTNRSSKDTIKQLEPNIEAVGRAGKDTAVLSQTGGITPLPPPLVDSMDINAGVVVREGDVVRRGPMQVPRKIDKRISPAQLQPLDTTSSARGTTEMVSRSSPIIKPLYLSEPIPPIPSSPQSA